MALHGTSSTLVLFLLGVALTEQQLQAFRSGVKTQQQLYDDAVVDGRIVGGTPTTAEDFPWQLYVKMETKAGTSVCGGSIISQSLSMSAAHCFASAKPDADEGFIMKAKK